MTGDAHGVETMSAYKIAISDCDHVNLDAESEVCRKAHVELVSFQLKTREDMTEALRPFKAVGVQYCRFTRELMSALPNLKCLVRYGVGVDNIDIKAASELGIAVCNVPDYGTQEVAAHALALMMALTRKLVRMDRLTKQGVWNYEKAIPLFRYSEMTVGVVGVGRIGRTFASLVQPLGCRVIACDPAFPAGGRMAEPFSFIELVSKEELLRSADVISLHSPLETSRGAVGESELRGMKPTAYLMNVTRGGVVDEDALVKALAEGWIAGAACDVFTAEPAPADHPLFAFENFIATPHMAWYSEQASRDLCVKLAEELVRAVKGEKLRYCLNGIS
jgi:D-3-phosphoglycerate dehydrogenase